MQPYPILVYRLIYSQVTAKSRSCSTRDLISLQQVDIVAQRSGIGYSTTYTVIDQLVDRHMKQSWPLYELKVEEI